MTAAAAERAACAHCGLPVDESESGDGPGSLIHDPDRERVVNHAPVFCCHGCRTLYALLEQSGLGAFYALRDRLGGGRPSRPVDAEALADRDSAYAHYDDPAFMQRYAPDGSQVQLHVEGVHCAACVWVMDQLPRVLPGVQSARLEFATGRLHLRWSPEQTSLARIGACLHGLGYPSFPLGEAAEAARKKAARGELLRLGVAFAVAGNVMLLTAALYAGAVGRLAQVLEWAALVLAIPSITYGALPFYRGALGGLRARRAPMDLPIALGLVGGFTASAYATLSRSGGAVYFDSVCLLVFLLLLGRFVQRRGQRAALSGTELLASLTPGIAWSLRSGAWHATPANRLRRGDRIRVRAGEGFPADGRVVIGESHVDLSLLTGESLPISVQVGSEIFAGTNNVSDQLEIEVTATGADARIGRLMALAEASDGERAPIVQMADRISGVFVVAVMGLAVLGGVAWWFIDPSRVFDVVVGLLVVSCPCALGLATPVALAAGRGRAARAGALVRSTAALERLAAVERVVLDKTGTLTEGRLSVTSAQGSSDNDLCETRTLDGGQIASAPGPTDRVVAVATATEGGRMQAARWLSDEAAVANGHCSTSPNELPASLRAALGALEARSAHPAARAVAAWAARDADAVPTVVTDVPPVVTDVVEHPSRGVCGRVDGRSVAVGSTAFLDAGDFAARVAEIVERGDSPLVVHLDGQAVGVLAVGDRVREDTPRALTRLRAFGVRLAIRSGDDPAVARSVAARLGITDARGGVTPEQKAIDAAAAPHTAMVGDGVNDAPALRAASVGVAIAGGAEAALQVADAYLTRPGLDSVVELFAIARRTMRVVHRNLAFSLAYNVLFATLALLGQITPLMAAILMPISSLTVVGSSVVGLRRTE